MTDLTRERLAELATRAKEIDQLHEVMLISPETVLALIAQCEAGLPASGGVSGEDGELSADVQKALIRLRMDDPRITDQTPRAKAITTLENALKAAVSISRAAAQGWQMVPKIATVEMMRAGADAPERPHWRDDFHSLWSAMLAAAPPSPAAQEQGPDFTEPTVGRTAWLPEAMDRALNSRAHADNVTKSRVMRRALAQYLAPEQEKVEPT